MAIPGDDRKPKFYAFIKQKKSNITNLSLTNCQLAMGASPLAALLRTLSTLKRFVYEFGNATGWHRIYHPSMYEGDSTRPFYQALLAHETTLEELIISQGDLICSSSQRSPDSLATFTRLRCLAVPARILSPKYPLSELLPPNLQELQLEDSYGNNCLHDLRV